MDWRIRPASIEDAERLALIGGATFLETFAGALDGDAIVRHCGREHSPSAYHAYLDAGAEAWLVETCLGHAPIGMSLLGSTNLPGSVRNGSDIELKRIYAFSRFHGCGIGAAWMQQALISARRSGADRLLLGVYVGNERARGFYAKHGFVQIADRKFLIGDHEYNDVVLARPTK